MTSPSPDELRTSLHSSITALLKLDVELKRGRHSGLQSGSRSKLLAVNALTKALLYDLPVSVDLDALAGEIYLTHFHRMQERIARLAHIPELEDPDRR